MRHLTVVTILAVSLTGAAAGTWLFYANTISTVVGATAPVEEAELGEGIHDLRYYPSEDLQIWAEQSTDDGTGLVIAESPDGSRGFQITVYPYDESDPLTPEMIRQALPATNMENFFPTSIPPATAWAFYSESDIGETFEVWVVYYGQLYQIVTYKDLDDWLQQLMKKWYFLSE